MVYVGSVVCFLAACAAPPGRAPVIDGRAPARGAIVSPSSSVSKSKEPDWRPGTYTVKQGDTLYSIALDHGLYYRDLAQWNGLADPNLILVDQVLRLTEPSKWTARQLEHPPVAVIPVVRGPRAVKLPYSDSTRQRLLALAEPAEPLPAIKVLAKGAVKTDAPKAVVPVPMVQGIDAVDRGKQTSGRLTSTLTSLDGDDDIDTWLWPTTGKVIQSFAGDAAKGIDIAGRRGQPVVAAAGGKVVYSGSGLRGYGRLLILKHNKRYLSAYAHNQKLLVNEGEVVKKGDRIAEMGDSDTNQVKLHFEIRRFGKPVDPLKFLPAEKS